MKKYKFLIKYIVIFLIILVFNMIITPTDLDEIWSYGFAISIRDGLIPYKDFNMVVTPLYPIIISLFLLISKNILVFHIAQSLIFTVMSIPLFKLIGKKSWLVLLFFFFPAPIFFPGYNLLLFFLLVLIIYLEKKKYNDLVIGIIIGLSFLTKQSVGILFLIPSLIMIKDKKKLLKRIEGFIIPCICLFIYLLITSSLNGFIDLCFLGLFDFGKDNGRLFTIYFFLTILLVIITIYFIIKNKKDINLLYILMFYSITVPMFDIKHFAEALLGFIFMLFYLDKIKIKQEYGYILLFGMILLIQSFIIFNDKIISKIEYPNHIKYFEYRLLPKTNIEITDEVNNYLEKNKIRKFYLLDSNSYYFKIINNQNIEYLDMLNTGNWGYNGKNKLLKELKTKKDYVFIIDKEELNRGKQTDKDAIKYIIKHGKKIDQIRFYDVYILK